MPDIDSKKESIKPIPLIINGIDPATEISSPSLDLIPIA